MHKVLNLAIFLVVFITFLNAMVFFGLGVYQSFVAYISIVTEGFSHHPGVIIVEALDRFLIGFVFIIFSIGLARLFLSDIPFLDKYELPWLKITDFNQLKTLLVSAILVALFVAWTPFAVSFTQSQTLDWHQLIFPACLLIMAVSAKVIKDLH